LPETDGRIKTPLPQWLPWATTACLAALVACLGELWILEKARIQLLHDENQMTEAALKAPRTSLRQSESWNGGN